MKNPKTIRALFSLPGFVARSTLAGVFGGLLGKIGQRNAALIRASYRQSGYGENLIKLYDRLLKK